MQDPASVISSRRWEPAAAGARCRFLRTAGALLAVLAALSGLFALVGWLATGPCRAAFDRFDYAVALAVHGWKSSAMDRLFSVLSNALEMEPVSIAAAAVFGWLLWRRRFPVALRMGVGLSGVGFMWLVTAGIVQRQRPNYWIVHDPSDIGYPSGHEMNAVVISALLLVAFIPRLRSAGSRAALVAACFLFIVATFVTRIYVQAHFASDMLAGFLMGLFWILAALRILRPYTNSQSLYPRRERNPAGA
jgi:undecaprenyl-diphosphatase